MDTATRFWSKVDVRSHDECWEWIGINSGFKTEKGSQNIKRVAWVLTFGEVPDGFRVYSSCKPNCVNPRHLFLSTWREMSSRLMRDRTGENHPSAILKKSQVERIRALTGKRTIAYLARFYGVSEGCIADIQKYRNWR